MGIYLLIGWVALMLAVGRGNKPFGSTIFWALFPGLLAYACRRFSEAIWGGRRRKGGASARIRSAVRGCVYALFALTTLPVLHGSGSSQATP